MAVRGVLAEADVGEQQQLGEARPQRAQRLLDDPVRRSTRPSPRRPSPRGCRTGSPRSRRRGAAPRTRARRRRPCAARAPAGARSAAPRARRRAAARGRRARASSRARGRAARRVRRSRRSRVVGKALTDESVRATRRGRSGASARSAAPPARPRPGSRRRPPTTRTRAARRRTPTSRSIAASSGSAISAPTRPLTSKPTSRPKITSSGCSRSALPITFGTTMWPSIWWMPRKSSVTQMIEVGCDDERVDAGGNRAEPRAEVRQHLGQRHPRAEDERVVLARAARRPVTPRM